MNFFISFWNNATKGSRNWNNLVTFCLLWPVFKERISYCNILSAHKSKGISQHKTNCKENVPLSENKIIAEVIWRNARNNGRFIGARLFIGNCSVNEMRYDDKTTKFIYNGSCNILWRFLNYIGYYHLFSYQQGWNKK